MIPLPYDLAWDAVNAVVVENSFHVQAQDMTNGIIEAVGPRFTLHDADCGKIKSVAGAYTAEPEQNSSSVYNFLVRPRGPEATLVVVRATFNSSVSVPLHPATDVDCVSHGIQESNLLREVLVEAKKTHRPTYAKPSAAPQQPESVRYAIDVGGRMQRHFHRRIEGRAHLDDRRLATARTHQEVVHRRGIHLRLGRVGARHAFYFPAIGVMQGEARTGRLDNSVGHVLRLHAEEFSVMTEFTASHARSYGSGITTSCCESGGG